MDPFYWFKRHEISRGISYRAALQPSLLSSLASGVKKKKKNRVRREISFCYVVCFFLFLCFIFISPPSPPPFFSLALRIENSGTDGAFEN